MRTKSPWLFRLITLFLALFLLEGLCGVIFYMGQVISSPEVKIAEHISTTYDAEIGWVGKPNFHQTDFYGPGQSLTTDSLGFRSSKKTSNHISKDKIRITCSGDSFTLGYGVDDQETWCHKITELDTRFETVNQGQGGYGPDQSYLLYKRYCKEIEQDIHIFALILPDFFRMQVGEYYAPKPKLELQESEIVVTGTPVPQISSFTKKLNQIKGHLTNFRSFKMLNKIFNKDSTSSENQSLKNLEKNKYTLKITTKILEELQTINQEKNTKFVVSLLPIQGDNDTFLKFPYRKHLQEICQEMDIPFWDLVNEYENLPQKEIKDFFIPKNSSNFSYAAGHYTAYGNKKVAQWFIKRLNLMLDLK